MNKQPEALLLAERLVGMEASSNDQYEAAAELRRLHEENVYLRDVYESLVQDRNELFDDLDKAVAAEREACAVVCERLPETFKIAADEFGYEAEMPTAENYAAAIRTRSDE